MATPRSARPMSPFLFARNWKKSSTICLPASEAAADLHPISSHLGNHGRLGRDVNRFKSYLSTICLTRPNAQQIPSLFDAGHWTLSGTALMDVPFCWLLVAKCEIFLVLHKMLLKSCRFIRIKGSYMRGKLKRNIWLHDLTPPQQRTSHKQPHCRKWSLHVLRPFLQAGRTNLPIMNSKGYCARGLGCKLEVKSQEPCMCVYI
jgi:hypothetical protein